MGIVPKAHRHHSRLSAWAVFIVLVVMASGFFIWKTQSFEYSVLPETREDSPEREALEKEIPAKLKVEKLGINTAFELLDLKENGELSVPESYETVGWYIQSPLPGETGPMVVVGHVDSKTGPAIFYDLGDLEVGDKIVVIKASGEEVVYRVRELERYTQNEFPTESVYGNTEGPELRLITCSGEYNQGTGRYSHNLVVYADIAP